MTQATTGNFKEQERIKAAAGGDPQAFREIVEAHQRMVYGTCLRVLGNEADAKDATQATFLVFHRKCADLKPGTVLGGWLYHAATLVSREHIRSAARRKNREEELGIMQSVAEENHDEIWNAVKPGLDQVLESLPTRYRDVVVLRYLEEKTNQETAKLLGLSTSAVTTRLARGLEHLRLRFRKKGIATTTDALSGALSGYASVALIPAGLADSILHVAGPGIAATSIPAPVSVMAKGALATMGSLLYHTLNLFVFVGWVMCTYDWITRGCPIPRWVHVLAVVMGSAGVGLAIWLATLGALNLPLAAISVAGLPVMTYVGWIWLLGPAFSKE